MTVKQRLRHRAVAQFHNPTGPGGSVAGWVMGRRSSNVRRNRWAAERLDIQPTDRIIELGCGRASPSLLSPAAPPEGVVGVDHSEVMIRQAGRRNAAAIRAGRIRLSRSGACSGAANADWPPWPKRETARLTASYALPRHRP
jgi:hypothetical protein